MDEMEQMADLVASLPLEIHFVGGPYCGFYLHPQSECIHDVHLDLDEGILPPSEPPFNFMPGSSTEIMLFGNEGSCVYVMESDKYWIFSHFVEPVNAGQSA